MDIKKLNITFNFATELAYEELTGNAFNPVNLVDENGKITTRELTNLTTAVIIAANPDVEDPTAFMRENTRQEVFELFTEVSKALHRWLIVPPVAEQHAEQPSSDASEEGDAKNS